MNYVSTTHLGRNPDYMLQTRIRKVKKQELTGSWRLALGSHNIADWQSHRCTNRHAGCASNDHEYNPQI